MNKTKIDWCDSTWNPVTGCLHGCEYCYARGISERFKMKEPEIYATPTIASNQIHELNEPLMYRKENEDWTKAAYPYGFSPTLYRYRLNDFVGKQGRNIFVCSMADLFGKWVPDSWIKEVFNACEKAPQHNYLFLTKNPERYYDLEKKGVLFSGDNMWYGASVTNRTEMEKTIPNFTCLQSGTKAFFSIEPILENIENFKLWNSEHNLQYIDWAIIGAETGRRKDKIVPERKWIEYIVNECKKENVPVFMKSSLADIWGEPLIQEFPTELKK